CGRVNASHRRVVEADELRRRRVDLYDRADPSRRLNAGETALSVALERSLAQVHDHDLLALDRLDRRGLAYELALMVMVQRMKRAELRHDAPVPAPLQERVAEPRVELAPMVRDRAAVADRARSVDREQSSSRS